jgi:histidinol-phosphate aminotransferase
MSLSRREFVRRLGRGSAGLASASLLIGYGHEELFALGYRDSELQAAMQAAVAMDEIKLSSNENLRGPSPKVIEALRNVDFSQLGLGYPVPHSRAFTEAIAKMWGAKPNNVITATGSGAILQAAQVAYVTDARPLVSGHPSYLRGAERPVPVDGGLMLDLDAMVAASSGAGLVFLCNPNNPTSTIHPLADIEKAVRAIKQRSPETAVLIDEAYIDYSTAPGVGSGAALALELPDVFMTRTFSKAYGLAGMRLGYAVGQPETVTKLRQAWGLGSINELQAVAGIAALGDTAHMDWERTENRRIREWTLAQFKAMGYGSPDSQTNFVFVNIGRPASEFREGCGALGVAVGRDFPPMEKTYARISLGKMEQMERAMNVFRQVLGHGTEM